MDAKKSRGRGREQKEKLPWGSFLSPHCSAGTWQCQKEASHFQHTHTYTNQTHPYYGPTCMQLKTTAVLVLHWPRCWLTVRRGSFTFQESEQCVYPEDTQNAEEPAAWKGNKEAVIGEYRMENVRSVVAFQRQKVVYSYRFGKCQVRPCCYRPDTD